MPLLRNLPAVSRCYVIQTIAKRPGKDLLNGKVYLDAVTYQVARFEGEPAKSPSWWLKDVKIVTNFSEVDGMWLQTSSMGTGPRAAVRKVHHGGA
jgi:hypothetical protein